MLGGVRIPWLADGRRVHVPHLELGEYLDALAEDVAVLRRLDLRDDTPQEVRERILHIADTAHAASVLYRRLRKADPALTRGAFEAHVASEADVLQLLAVVQEADDPKARTARPLGLAARLLGLARGLLTRTRSRAGARVSRATQRRTDGG